ncbi:MAG TPA: peptidylprolyl isomerase [Candidatus Limnocylindria bacterium]|nr:peptidylprolyl isomerase [Candidatus Limnocylindria bacterium]
MARRIPLPRLTQRQRMARWQRERRQQTVIVTIFSAVLFFTVGLVAWAATDRYYSENLKTAVMFDGRAIPMRDYTHELGYQYARFYVDYGVPPGYENDQQILEQKATYASVALETLVERTILELNAKADGISYTAAQIDERFTEDFGEYHPRHILIKPSGDDTALADANALAKARAIADQLKEAPNDQALWNSLASQYSEDPGSKDSGGDLGFVGKGQFVKEFEDAVRGMTVGQVSDPVKSSFGYHVIQLIERRSPEEGAFVQRVRSYGYTIEDVKAHVRFDMLKDEYTARAKAVGITSPAPQVRVAWIAVAAPRVTGGDFQAFTDQLKKVSDIQSALDDGKDFAEVAKQYSEDGETKEKGGEIGWFARGMVTRLDIEAELFSLPVGKVSGQRSDSSQTAWYKVLERDESRAIDDDQKKKISDNAYSYWYQHQKKAHTIQKVVPGHETDS